MQIENRRMMSEYIKEEILNKWKREDYNYVVLFRINDDFINRYSDLYENPNEIKDKCLYEITDKMQLKLCE